MSAFSFIFPLLYHRSTFSFFNRKFDQRKPENMQLDWSSFSETFQKINCGNFLSNFYKGKVRYNVPCNKNKHLKDVCFKDLNTSRLQATSSFSDRGIVYYYLKWEWQMTTAKEVSKHPWSKPGNGHEAEFSKLLKSFSILLEPVFWKHPEYIEEKHPSAYYWSRVRACVLGRIKK